MPQSDFLRFHEISKEFPGVKALSNVSFAVSEGSVHALTGENGAGKSTLLKILSGYYTPSAGNLIINNTPHVFSSSIQALNHGIAVIYQELHLVPEMTVAENIFLGQLPTTGIKINKKALNENAALQLRSIGEDIDPNTLVKYLPLAQRQMVEIAKALSRNAKIIAFDEPTSSLSAREITNLFKVIRDLKQKGHAIIYVSHRMEEIFSICDALTVFKDGEHVDTFPDISVLTEHKLVQLMVGREIRDVFQYRERTLGNDQLRVKSIAGPGLSVPVSFTVKKGEVLGLFGLIGAGRTELLKLLFGATPIESGTIELEGIEIKIRRPRDAIAAGITFCPEDRKSEGIIPDLSVAENINISAQKKHAYAGIVVNKKWENNNADLQINELNIKTPGLQQKIVNLSGGNQQKAILGRWLSEDMRVLLLDEPTRGIDIGAKSGIYNIIFKLAESGIAVVVVSSDLPEVIGISDRILVMRNGAISGEFLRGETTEEKLLAAAMLDTSLTANSVQKVQ